VLSKNEVHGPFNVASPVELDASFCEQGILIAIESDTVIALVAPTGTNGKGLLMIGPVSERILYVDIV